MTEHEVLAGLNVLAKGRIMGRELGEAPQVVAFWNGPPLPPPPKPTKRDWLVVDSGKILVENQVPEWPPLHLFRPPGTPPSLKEIMAAVVAETGIPALAIRSHRRQRPLVRARQIFAFAAKTLTMKGYPEIGRNLFRDHSTIMHSVCKVEDHRDTFEPELRRVLERFETAGATPGQGVAVAGRQS